MKLRFAILCTLLTASASLAQAVLPRIAIIRVDNPNLATYTFGAAECNATLTVGWTNTVTAIRFDLCTPNPLKIWATAGECLDTGPGVDDTRYDDVPNLTLTRILTGTFPVKISGLPAFKATTTTDGGTLLPCGGSLPFTKTQQICGSVDYSIPSTLGCGTASHYPAVALKLVYDTQPPSPPVITDYAPQDKGVRMGFTVGSDTTTVLMEAQGPADTDYRQLAEVATTIAKGSIKGEHLENNVTYNVRLRARDAAGNVSDPSDAIMVTPILTLGFWGYYKDAGGTDSGGCSVGAGLMPLLFAAFAFRRARKQVRRQP